MPACFVLNSVDVELINIKTLSLDVQVLLFNILLFVLYSEESFERGEITFRQLKCL